ncbi:30S ribosomal protein S18 [Candidatus Roizmanbacteria bacterium RIFCSPLOWO2_01_FULL_42_14]|uniref:Small ribosomal subunit protein bS18 n=2 Tax=Candidatus Roizmaniibacteriota TaxID=1752723 RepID=A0A1F7JTF9_9BACT|nr:MAG: 30S ribosomal protein S18 [Candidatus Roizmanbacteria bacterium RIFCSPLOWO2_01_FULL_42_14]OGK58903.1 MAG: 30S ribosomal protein S18 [Candidatus Roizmanbacteria bacterium RIFCSPLOWO2_02_FULL_43_10]
MARGDYFKTHNIQPSYKDPEVLARFITPRGKIIPKDKSGLTAKNQRVVTQQIKYARFLNLLPYTSYQQEHLRHLRKSQVVV